MTVLINASNLHVGGGIQVAASFINELYDLYKNHEKIDFHIIVSNKVYENLNKEINISKFSFFCVFDIFGKNPPPQYIIDIFNDIDIIFTIFGPLYLKCNAKIKITGFAQPWIAYPKNSAYSKLPIREVVQNKIKFFIQKYYFKKDNHLVVEAEHVKKALVKRKIKNDKEISVISNTYSHIFDQPYNWKPIDFQKKKYTLGFIGKSYPHKNIKILLDVDNILKNKYHLFCDFLFTLSDIEMNKLNFSKKDNFISIGTINIDQCPNFYKNIDALIFPSLLECFSASPVEAMRMSCLVLASDLPFIKDICKDSAFYFNPLNPNDIAKVIYTSYLDETSREEKIINGLNIVKNIHTSKDRAIKYIEIINKFKKIFKD
ncbi:glycosyltransferase [Proteus sp. G2667]|uniref:glycosyltransferase n=1 Tax=Proteus sp. G2667 TaxID=2698880 RepID=UPI001377FDFA|nr:glycosyltransferase [Proteus sp. G2667]NBM57123.1 glycosyltransferase [Proteus sp. G2667]